jgi:hypothetical protein
MGASLSYSGASQQQELSEMLNKNKIKMTRIREICNEDSVTDLQMHFI